MKLARITLALGLLLIAGAAAAEYYPPTRRTVLNEVIAPAADPELQFPLYLSKRGAYYAELIREPPAGDGSAATPAAAAADLAFTIQILREGEVLFSQDYRRRVSPDFAGETLFWLDVPSDLPQRRDLNVIVRFDPASAGRDQPTPGLRLQITRKLELLPLRPF